MSSLTLADALSLPPDEAQAPLELTPQKRKQKTLEALLQLVLAASAKQPVVLSRGHWIDPTYGSASAKLKYTSNCVPPVFCVTL